MNERIKELAKQSLPEFYLTNCPSALEKFAELIVRECAGVCNQHPSRIVSNNWPADSVAPDIVSRLNQHFGVEE